MTTITPSTYLFVPALTIERVDKAFAKGADAVIVDLEDAVSDSVKAQCQQNLQQYVSMPSARPVWVRVNAVTSDWFAQDLNLCRQLPNLAGIVLPKVISADDIAQVHTQLPDLPIIALIECPQGIANIDKIAQSQGLFAMSFGFLDICDKLGVKADSDAAQMLANHIRYQLLLHSHLNELVAPIECVYPSFNDDNGLAKRVAWWTDLGFSGMLCIHPNQLSVVANTAKPSAEQIAFAQKVVAHHDATGLAAFAIEGEMVDTPVITQARRLLQRLANQ